MRLFARKVLGGPKEAMLAGRMLAGPACVVFLGALLTQGCASERGVAQGSTAPAPFAPLEPENVASLSSWPTPQLGLASYYAKALAGHRTSSGEPYDPGELTAAHRTLPFGTIALIRREDGRAVVVRINDRGPYVHGRIIDLSRRAADAIGLVHDGIAEVEVRPITRALRYP